MLRIPNSVMLPDSVHTELLALLGRLERIPEYIEVRERATCLDRAEFMSADEVLSAFGSCGRSFGPSWTEALAMIVSGRCRLGVFTLECPNREMGTPRNKTGLHRTFILDGVTEDLLFTFDTSYTAG